MDTTLKKSRKPPSVGSLIPLPCSHCLKFSNRPPVVLKVLAALAIGSNARKKYMLGRTEDQVILDVDASPKAVRLQLGLAIKAGLVRKRGDRYSNTKRGVRVLSYWVRCGWTVQWEFRKRPRIPSVERMREAIGS